MTTKFIRVQNPIALDYLREYLIPGEGVENVDSMVETLKNILMSQKDRTYYSIVVDEDTSLVLCFVLAYVPPGTNYAVVFQLSEAPTVKPKLVETMFLRFLMWCEENEIVEVRMDDLRNDAEKQKQWGFETHMVVRKLNVTSAIERRLGAEEPKELENESIPVEPGADAAVSDEPAAPGQ